MPAAEVPAISTIVAISRRARVWVPIEPPGTCGASPRRRRSATASTIRQMTKCAHASQTTAASTPRIVSVVVGLVSHSMPGAVSGHGVPKAMNRTTGRPKTISSVPMRAAIPLATSAPRLGSFTAVGSLLGWRCIVDGIGRLPLELLSR